MPLIIESTSSSPEVRFDLDGPTFLIKGRSMPQDAEKFYGRILGWLDDNLPEEPIEAHFDMLLDYYNTGSYIRLIALFNKLAALNKQGHRFDVRWFCEEDDEDMVEDGESFKQIVKVPFEVFTI